MRRNRVQAEVSDAAWRKLKAEVRRRGRLEGRGRDYPVWRIIEDLLNTLPSPEQNEPEERTLHASYNPL